MKLPPYCKARLNSRPTDPPPILHYSITPLLHYSVPRRVHPRTRTLTLTRTRQYICIRSVITFSTR